MEKSFCGVRIGAASAASGDAVSDGGALAPVAAARWSQIDCAGTLPGSAGSMAESRHAGRVPVGSGSDQIVAHDPRRDEARSEKAHLSGVFQREPQDS